MVGPFCFRYENRSLRVSRLKKTDNLLAYWLPVDKQLPGLPLESFSLLPENMMADDIKLPVDGFLGLSHSLQRDICFLRRVCQNDIFHTAVHFGYIQGGTEGGV